MNNCKICKKETRNKSFCSNACRDSRPHKITKCPICETPHRNKVYCSEQCQYKGYSQLNPIKINICPVCGNKTKNKIHCSRTCYAITDSKSKKEFYNKHGHHSKGRKPSDEENANRATSLRIAHQLDPNIRIRMAESSKMTAIRNGYANGWSQETREKRKLKPSNLIGKYGTRPCDISFEKQHGMTSIQYAFSKLQQTNETSIEKIVRLILNKYSINYTQEFLFSGHYFDFLLLDYNIIIECDGDYFHSYNVLLEDMDSTQKNSYKNDIKKNKIINDSNYQLVRFWEHEINAIGFEDKLIQLWQK